MRRIEVSEIKVGMRFSAPVFFEDGKNMFIESDIATKPYHISALTKWNIPYLLTDGELLQEGEVVSRYEEKSIEDVEALEELDELDVLDEIETLSDEEISDLDEL